MLLSKVCLLLVRVNLTDFCDDVIGHTRYLALIFAIVWVRLWFVAEAYVLWG